MGCSDNTRPIHLSMRIECHLLRTIFNGRLIKELVENNICHLSRVAPITVILLILGQHKEKKSSKDLISGQSNKQSSSACLSN